MNRQYNWFQIVPAIVFIAVAVGFSLMVFSPYLGVVVGEIGFITIFIAIACGFLLSLTIDNSN
jgi:hypothetical protein